MIDLKNYKIEKYYFKEEDRTINDSFYLGIDDIKKEYILFNYKYAFKLMSIQDFDINYNLIFNKYENVHNYIEIFNKEVKYISKNNFIRKIKCLKLLEYKQIK